MMIPICAREEKEKKDNPAQISLGCLSLHFLWFRNTAEVKCASEKTTLAQELDPWASLHVRADFFWRCRRQVIRDLWLSPPEWQLSSITAFIMTQAGKLQLSLWHKSPSPQRCGNNLPSSHGWIRVIYCCSPSARVCLCGVWPIMAPNGIVCYFQEDTVTSSCNMAVVINASSPHDPHQNYYWQGCWARINGPFKIRNYIYCGLDLPSVSTSITLSVKDNSRGYFCLCWLAHKIVLNTSLDWMCKILGSSPSYQSSTPFTLLKILVIDLPASLYLQPLCCDWYRFETGNQ